MHICFTRTQWVKKLFSIHWKSSSSWCQLCCHWWHCRVSSWQPLVSSPRTKMAPWELLLYRIQININLNILTAWIHGRIICMYSPGDCFTNTNMLSTLEALKCSGCSTYLFVCGWDILCGILKLILEIPHKISSPYVERYDFYIMLTFKKIFYLRAHMHCWKIPQFHYNMTQYSAVLL